MQVWTGEGEGRTVQVGRGGQTGEGQVKVKGGGWTGVEEAGRCGTGM